jgi:hypothetical protein
MLRRGSFLCLLAATLFSYAGCRSCSSCHDCDPPVANCGAGGCGCHRAGSVSGHYPPGEYAGEEYAIEAGPNSREVQQDATEAPMDIPIEAPTMIDRGEMP